MKTENKNGRKVLLLLSCVILLVAVLCSCGSKGFSSSKETTEPTTEPPKPVVIADGKSGSLTCKDTYTVETGTDADAKVAEAGDAFLTNAQLQSYYEMAVADHMHSAEGAKPDLSLPLESQICPLGSGDLSWQHYFLQQALNAWYNASILNQEAEEPILITEEGYETVESYHNDNIHEELPAYDLLYHDKPCYKPNSQHQAYLDQLPEQMGNSVKQDGYASLADFADQVMGSDANALIEAAKYYNLGYMFYTEKRYDMIPSGSEISEYIAVNGAQGDDTIAGVNIRHLLRIPEGAQIAADGTVTASEDAWAACMKETKEIVLNWSRSWLTNRDKDSSFSRLAYANSQDEGTNLVGGLYANVQKGQLIPELDNWVFADGRAEKDYEIFQTKFGVQVLYISAINDTISQNAKTSLMQEKEQALMDSLREKYPLSIDYSKAALWVNTEKATLSLGDVLYADVAHQRFPEAIVYLQQDYPHARYGGGWVARGGCGVTTMAMLATYMTDTIYTPGYLASIYGYYRTSDGTNGDMFRYVPAELGFQFDYSTSSYDQIFEELQHNKRVISLQILGHFTRAGHYLLLERANDDGTVVVRDSNIFNYKRLSGHMIDCFTRENILSGNSIFYVMQEKVVSIPACARCGDPHGTKMPVGMLNSPYICERCSTAMARRSEYTALN